MAKMFQFPLQKVLSLREMIEESRAITLENSRRALKQEQEKLQNLESRKESLLEEEKSNDMERMTLSLNDLRVSMQYISQLNDMISNQMQQVERSNELVQRERDNLLEASKDRKIVEKLRERHLANYIKSYRKKEMKKESEIALRVAVKNNTSGDDS